ncbi:Crp/Fnr family transcriptional regulator [Goodfellowiella coeruleoviolacea]|uniref:cAMP-binding domain of CRP or a regulatory subunit of cAMP-dependent protein kinases n=1 Tax=Goodfellowiella coeruleoviolacea TaxID=334858 RepID=A0AAE3GCJ6_9PSEU|nr:Crp/Fnr family transcriptional regulator [Goodfellowiella coeruleoviolacea]MCP2164910.1 cAMP-binding domain of CRP or a regulatory subunit of cAMP-dependent protein kinases [Goodfellowiella coeruleoviolacea]
MNNLRHLTGAPGSDSPGGAATPPGAGVGARWAADHAPTTFADRMPRGELLALLDRGRAIQYRPGEYLMREGEVGDCVIVLRTGQVKVVTGDEDGTDRLLGVRGRGELLGEMACLDGRPRSASVLAHSGVHGIKVSRDRFVHFLDHHPRAAQEVARQVVARLRAADRRHIRLTSHEVGTRLVGVLLELVGVFQDQAEGRGVEIPLSQEELAQLAMASEVSAQRALRPLRTHRLVRTGYRRLLVPCLPCFVRLAPAVLAAGPDAAATVFGCGGAADCRFW